MMTVAPVASAADAAGYYSSKDNYYFLDDLDSQWLGEGARELGLEGPVDLQAFTDVLYGKLPDGSVLGKEVLGSHVHRPGHDLTFSAPKSISMLILAGGDKRLLEAHHEAVKETLAVIEGLISTRITHEGETRTVLTGKMVAALFTHDTSRNLDPQVHTHTVIANATEHEGKWRALSTDYIHKSGFIETIYRNQVGLGKIYRNSLKGKTEALGYETELTGGRHDLWEVKGFSEEVLDGFSSRHREILARVGEDASLRSRDVAALDTRQRKQDISRYRDESREVTPPAGAQAPGEPGQRHTPAAPALTGINPALTPENNSPVIAKDTALSRENNDLHGPDRATEPDNARVSVKGGPGKDESQPITKPETADGRARLQARWQRQMADTGFDIGRVMEEARERQATLSAPVEPGNDSLKDAMQAVREAISMLSDSKARFTFGDLLLAAHQSGGEQHKIADLRYALDRAVTENLLVPLDREKGVFTSQIHLLDELSVQALAKDILSENTVVRFRVPEKEFPAALKAFERSPLAVINAPASVSRLRESTEQLVTMSRTQGRDVSVLVSSSERAVSFGRSEQLADRLISRSRLLDSTFSLAPQSTLVIEGAEKLSLKEMLVLTGEAKEKSAQLLFLDSGGRQSNTSALSVLMSAGVTRHSLNAAASGLEATVISIQDKRERYSAIAERFAELYGTDMPVTAAVTGPREQQQLSGMIREALQEAGKLGPELLTVEARTPVYVSAKTRRMPVTYRPGMVLEDRSDREDVRHYTVDRVHEDTRMLSLADSDGVLQTVRLADLTADWRLFTREQLSVAQGEQLFAVATDKSAGVKARDRLTVTAFEDGALVMNREGQKKPIRVPADRPLYVTHAYVSAPGSRDNEQGTVLASLSARDLSANMINALSQSGSKAEIFTGEAQTRAEDRLSRLSSLRSPLELVRRASGQDVPDAALKTLNENLLTDTEKSVARAVAQMRHVTFSDVKLIEEALTFGGTTGDIRQEIRRQVKAGELIAVQVLGEPRYVARSAWEMEKAIIGHVVAGKNTRSPLMEHVSPDVLTGLTAGQRSATELILQSTDRFTAVQGYAGVGKTTQFSAVRAAIDLLPEEKRPIIVGLGPTHRSVREMASTGIDAQTVKSFVLDWQQRTAAGETVSYDNMLFLIDESSMLGNQDTAAVYQAIAAGNGRAVSVGDTDQLTSPESGAPFRLIQERSPIDVAVMKEIVRQSNTDLKAAVYNIIDSDVAAALKNVQKVSPSVVPRRPGSVVPAGSVIESSKPVDVIVADFISRTDEARDQTMILVQLHDDRRAINRGIHEALAERGELGKDSVSVPVLDRINGGRHDFNRLKDWREGLVVLANERYLTVSEVDTSNGLIVLKDESDRLHYYSPKELNATEVEVFEKREISLSEGDSVRLNKTQKQAGHAAHEQYRVAALRENGEILLTNQSGEKVIHPGAVTADRHLDYAWAVTGYGGQGASARYSLVLEGTQGAREWMSGMRAFYINVSRAREHVQIVTDGQADWLRSLEKKDHEPASAHDALTPQAEREQARRIWSMGQAVRKTAIGRTYLREQGLTEQALTARVIPPMKKYPDAHLALPLYDGNGKAAGLALMPLRPDAGRIREGEIRMVATGDAQAALFRRSRNGETRVVESISDALSVAKVQPDAGILIKTGEQEPSQQLLKITRGQTAVSEDVVRSAWLDSEQPVIIPDEAVPAHLAELPEDRVIQLAASDIRVQEAPAVPDEYGDWAREMQSREAELASELGAAVQPDDTGPDVATPEREAAIPDERSRAEQLLPAESDGIAVGDIRLPDEPRRTREFSAPGEQQLARDIQAAEVPEKALAREAREALQPSGPERVQAELTPERTRQIQKER
ncbi:conjugal transfer protein TraI [Pantoea ananatis]|uniref:MobF family relaxase n=1 Tax=Pantoea ananas TaxID=553 RepID=UPI000CF4C566|nr:MobF family relaxase [Pantoea ananatis]PQK95191.1 conjugal transfer protein TraI [Pantoea ananatis]